MSNIILHIGYSKAASTWLQNIFQGTGTLTYCHKPRLWRNSGSKICWDSKLLSKIVKTRPHTEGPLLISNEHMILPGIHPTLACATTNLKYVQDLAEFIDDNLCEPRVILIIRRQDAIIASRYHQYIMQGGDLKFESFLNRLLPDDDPSEYCDYRFGKVIATLQQVIGKDRLLVNTVDGIKANPDSVVRDCSEFIGAKMATCDFKAKRKVNVGFSRFAARVVRAINSLLVIEKERVDSKTLTRVPFKLWVYIIVAIWKLDNKIFINRKRPPLMDANQELLLRSIFKNDNLRLAGNYEAVKNWL